MQIIINAVEGNREGVLLMSREMGFLTGYETKQMEEAHVDAVMILGEMFRFDGEFDFGKQVSVIIFWILLKSYMWNVFIFL